MIFFKENFRKAAIASVGPDYPITIITILWQTKMSRLSKSRRRIGTFQLNQSGVSLGNIRERNINKTRISANFPV